MNQVAAINGPITKPNLPISSTTHNPARPKTTALPKLDVVLSEVPHAQARFFETLQRELRPSVSKVKLYLDDARTVKVLLEHVVGRIEAVYERFGDAMFAVKQLDAGRGGEEQVEIVSSSGLRDILREICEDSSLTFSGFSVA